VPGSSLYDHVDALLAIEPPLVHMPAARSKAFNKLGF
jgi:hypothetical protein